jgi:hypothetical protein
VHTRFSFKYLYNYILLLLTELQATFLNSTQIKYSVCIGYYLCLLKRHEKFSVMLIYFLNYREL